MSSILVKNLDDIKKNISTIENYLRYGTEEDKKYSMNLIKRGVCFIAYKVGDEIGFIPSRFVGYENNDRHKHEVDNRHGQVSNIAIKGILGCDCCFDEDLEAAYKKYCDSLSIDWNAKGSFGRRRKYWKIF